MWQSDLPEPTGTEATYVARALYEIVQLLCRVVERLDDISENTESRR